MNEETFYTRSVKGTNHEKPDLTEPMKL